MTVTRTVLNTGAVLAIVLLLTVVGPALDGPTEAQAAQAVAEDTKEARVEAFVQAARQANPRLSESELSRVRAAAMYLEGMRP